MAASFEYSTRTYFTICIDGANRFFFISSLRCRAVVLREIKSSKMRANAEQGTNIQFHSIWYFENDVFELARSLRLAMNYFLRKKLKISASGTLSYKRNFARTSSFRISRCRQFVHKTEHAQKGTHNRRCELLENRLEFIDRDLLPIEFAAFTL